VRLLLANPNRTASITDACAALARATAAPGTEIVPWTNAEGPAVVDSLYNDSMAGGSLAARLSTLAPRPDAVVLAGFGNYGTGAVKETLDVPVVGMAEAAMAFASLLGHRFAIVTTSQRMIPYTEDLVEALGFGARCAAVRAVELPPITAGEPPAYEVAVSLATEAAAVHARCGADVAILGGARLSPYAAAVQARTTVVIVEPVACAVTMAEAQVRLGLRHSKIGKFASPPLVLARGPRIE
jgi:allantoin racemase